MKKKKQKPDFSKPKPVKAPDLESQLVEELNLEDQIVENKKSQKKSDEIQSQRKAEKQKKKTCIFDDDVLTLS